MTWVVVDFSNIARACWHPAVAAQESNSKYDAHQVFKNNLAMKMETIEKGVSVPPGKYVMALDSKANWKKTVFLKYKANRDPNDFDPRPEAEAFLRQRWPTMGWAASPKMEADDVIATLVASYTKTNEDVIVVSGDHDLWQLMSPLVRIFIPTKTKFATAEMVAEKYGVCDPKHIRLHKTLWGDASDNLPNCAPRMQRQLLPLFEEARGDLMDMLALAADKKVNATCLGHLVKNLSQLVVNWELVRLNDDVPLEWRPNLDLVKGA